MGEEKAVCPMSDRHQKARWKQGSGIIFKTPSNRLALARVHLLKLLPIPEVPTGGEPSLPHMRLCGHVTFKAQHSWHKVLGLLSGPMT